MYKFAMKNFEIIFIIYYLFIIFYAIDLKYWSFRKYVKCEYSS